MRLALDLALGLDPVALMEAAGLIPDAWQKTVLRSRSKQMLLLCGRQTGKSTATGALAAHTVIYQPGSLVLLLSPSLRQSGELFRKVLGFLRASPDAPKATQESVLRLELTNGSRVVSLPGSEETTRGFSGVDLLVVDEAARVDDDLYFSVRPMLAVSNGRFIALTTPRGKRGWFFEEWHGSSSWERLRITADECPRISKEFLQEEKKTLGPRWFSQEYFCSFEENDDSVFMRDDIDAAISSEIQPLFCGGS